MNQLGFFIGTSKWDVVELFSILTFPLDHETFVFPVMVSSCQINKSLSSNFEHILSLIIERLHFQSPDFDGSRKGGNRTSISGS